MCAFKLVLTPIDLSTAFDNWRDEQGIDDSNIERIDNMPHPNDYYPRLVCFNLQSDKGKVKVWAESLSVNEVRSMTAFTKECAI